MAQKLIDVRIETQGTGGFWKSWWRHQMETFSALPAICAGNSPVTGEFPTQRPVTQSFDVFFDLCQNEWLSKQWGGWGFETPSRPLWCHCNVNKRNSSAWHTDTSAIIECNEIGQIIYIYIYVCVYSRGNLLSSYKIICDITLQNILECTRFIWVETYIWANIFSN